MEAGVGIEPTRTGFAVLCITTLLPGQSHGEGTKRHCTGCNAVYKWPCNIGQAIAGSHSTYHTIANVNGDKYKAV